MEEYKGKDKKEIGEAFTTLISKCLEGKATKCSCVMQFGDTFLDCHFEFMVIKK